MSDTDVSRASHSLRVITEPAITAPSRTSAKTTRRMSLVRRISAAAGCR